MDKLVSPLKIRAHHLLCLLSFRGVGYSKEFALNMEKVAKTIFSNDNGLRLTDGCDTICFACPHRKGDECHKDVDSEQRTKRQDNKVASKLGVQVGAELSWQEALVLIRQRITRDSLADICHDCEWLKFGYCVDALKKLHQSLE